MNFLTIEKFGGISLITGSLLLTAYSALFPALLPLGNGTYDCVQMVLNPNWVRLALIAFAGVILMLIGFYAVYARIRSSAGLVGAIGFLFIEAAYLLQACKVTWELFLYPIIASHPESALSSTIRQWASSGWPLPSPSCWASFCSVTRCFVPANTRRQAPC